MSDSQKVGASEDEVLVTPPEDSSTDEVEAKDPEPDLTGLRKEFDTVRAQTATRAEIDSLRRQAGHVPSLQSKVAELEGKLSRYDSIADRLDAYELLLMDVLPPESVEKVESQRAGRTTEELLDAKLKPLLERLEPSTTTEEPDVATTYAQWELQGRIDAATAFVKSEATKAGIDPDSIPSEVWQGAQAKHGLDLEACTLEVLNYVNEQAKQGSASTRRAERKAAAEGGNSPERAGAMGQYDMSTLQGAAKARKDGAITSEQFMEVFRRVQSGR